MTFLHSFLLFCCSSSRELPSFLHSRAHCSNTVVFFVKHSSSSLFINTHSVSLVSVLWFYGERSHAYLWHSQLESDPDFYHLARSEFQSPLSDLVVQMAPPRYIYRAPARPSIYPSASSRNAPTYTAKYVRLTPYAGHSTNPPCHRLHQRQTTSPHATRSGYVGIRPWSIALHYILSVSFKSFVLSAHANHKPGRICTCT